MAKIILNISKAYSSGFIADIEKKKYFQLHKTATTRADLLCFAIAIAKMEGKKPSDIKNADTFVRKEYMVNSEPLLSSVYFEEKLKDNTDIIDDICNRDEVYALAENYANSGFEILKDWVEEVDDEALYYKLISYMNNRYDEIKDELNALVSCLS